MKKIILLFSLLFAFNNYAQTVSTLAGSGITGFSDGDGIIASFQQPYGLSTFNAAGDLYVADNNSGHSIRRIVGVAATVTTFAGSGNGMQGTTNGTGTAARFTTPQGTAVDSNGNCFVIEYGPSVIRRITPAGVVTTYAAQTASPGVIGIADLSGPRGIAIDGSNSIYVANGANHKIIKITSAGVASTIAGSGSFGSADGTGAAATFYNPAGLDLDPSGNIYVADTFNNSIRKITPAGVVTTLAGGTSGFADATGSSARFRFPEGIAVDGIGNVYVADTNNHRIRQITPTGVVTTIAGGNSSGDTNGGPTVSRLSGPKGIAINTAGNTLYVSDSSNRKIKKIVQLPLSIADFNANNLKFSMYPNPTNSILNIDSATEIKNVEIYSLHGQKVLSATEKQVNISGLSSGIYMVRVQDVEGGVATQKLVKN